MPRWSGQGQSESRVLSEGDARFIGMDLTRDPPLLQPGMLHYSGNKRLLNGVAETRPGIQFPPDFNPGYTNQLVGSGVFSNPNGDEMLLVGELNANFIWALEFGKDPVQIPIVNPDSVAGESGILDCQRVRFVQAFDHVYALRRPSGTHTALIWDGAIPGQFVPVKLQAGAPGTSVVIPGGTSGTPVVRSNLVSWNGEPFAERILFYNDFDFVKRDGTVPDRDTLIMTDTDRWDSYDRANGAFRINSGESNVLTRVLGYYRGSVLVFFRRSIHILENFTTPVPTATPPIVGDQRQINNFLGCVSNQSMCQVGVDVYFLSEPGRGVYRISEAVQEQIAVNPMAVSDPLQGVIDLINWNQAAQWASMRALGPYVYLAVPINYPPPFTPPRGNNVVLVYNQYSRQWESIDFFLDPNFSFQEMHVLLCGDVRQMVAVDWYRKQVHGMYYGGLTDMIGVGGAEYTIQDLIQTRGYTLGDPTAFKRFERTSIAVETFDPEFKVSSNTDGYNEVKLLTDVPVTKNRLRYYIHGHKFYTEGVDSEDAPKREDYSAANVNYAIEDFQSLQTGPLTNWPGVNATTYTGEDQSTVERFQIRQNGRWVFITINNAFGRCNVAAVSVDGIPVQEGIRTLA